MYTEHRINKIITNFIHATNVKGVFGNTDVMCKLIAYTEYDLSINYSNHHRTKEPSFLVSLDWILRNIKYEGLVVNVGYKSNDDRSCLEVYLELLQKFSTRVTLNIKYRDWSLAEWDDEWERIK